MENSKDITSEYLGFWNNSELLTSKENDNLQNKIRYLTVDKYIADVSADIPNKSESFSQPSSPNLELPSNFIQYDVQKNRKYSKKVQTWRGIVTSFNKDNFIGRLEDLTLGGTDEIVEFENDNISPEDLPLLKEGANFYWSIGHFVENGQVIKKSQLRFQRLIFLTESEIDLIVDSTENSINNLKFR